MELEVTHLVWQFIATVELSTPHVRDTKQSMYIGMQTTQVSE